ncbi:MAG TPA: GGDEF domain-containing protein [Planctomycetaceae bacterium]|jgi:diguanylate cyclase (GGDEF)-like protein|nr:GGDEF domain-containing protein [Planctomycetaceae bacterium]
MTPLATAIDYLFQFCDRAVSGGYLVAMVLICALQYMFNLFSSQRSRELKERLCRQIDDVQKNLRTVSRDRTLTSLENQILREFTGELDLDRTLEQLISRLVDGGDGFAAYVPLALADQSIRHALGLSEQSRNALVVDPELLKRVGSEGVAAFRRNDLTGTRLFASLEPADRQRFDRLFIAGIGDPECLAGVIVTTALIPPGIPLEEQIELARRLMRSLSGIVRRSTEIEVRDQQLQSINEIMELRAVTDQKHASPLDMVEAFVDRLREMTGAERAVLFLITPDGRGSYKPLCRCGDPLAAGISRRHAEFEAILAEAAIARKNPEALFGAELARMGVNSIIGAAIIAPVISPNGIAGALCLTRQAKEPFENVRPQLLAWAARYLSETLLRVLHQAVSEWHARHDPLTDLSNRRTFDSELAAALRSSTAQGTKCALLMVDIDRFKAVNDRYGHLVGDEVLRCVSRVLKETVSRLSTRTSGLAARFGGEEFAVLLPGISAGDATWVAETIRSSVEVLPIHSQQGQINVTVSIGLAVFPDHSRTSEELIAVADAALYQAKDSGRNQVICAGGVAAG